VGPEVSRDPLWGYANFARRRVQAENYALALAAEPPPRIAIVSAASDGSIGVDGPCAVADHPRTSCAFNEFRRPAFCWRVIEQLPVVLELQLRAPQRARYLELLALQAHGLGHVLGAMEDVADGLILVEHRVFSDFQ
jgi:hypothetical protein